jgi:autotransporter-associated beta strand protein
VDDNPFSLGDFATISGPIADGSGVGGIEKTGTGRLVLSSNNTYTGSTIVSGGTLVLKDTANAAFLARNITTNATLEFDSTSVDINYTGAVNGFGSLAKSGIQSLYLSGTASNTYSGTTIVAGGTLVLAKTNGAVAIPGNVLMTDVPGGGSSFLVLNGDNQIASSCVMSFYNPNAWGHFDLNGHTQTLAGINDTDGWGVIEGRWDNTGLNADSVLIINGADPSTFNGTIRDKCQGTGYGRLRLVKNGTGTLTISGPSTGQYTGGLIVNNGTLNYSGGALPACYYKIYGGTLNIGALAQSITSFQMTGGLVLGDGTLTSTSAYDLQNGTVSVNLGGNAGLIKSTSGVVSMTKNLPSGNYVISGGILNINGLSQTVGTLQLSGGTVTGTGSLTSGSPYDLQSGMFIPSMGGSAGLIKSTPGYVSLVRNLPGGNYVISDGTLNINGLSRSISAFQLIGGTVTGTGMLSSSTAFSVRAGMIQPNLAGSVGLNKSGPGTAVLNGLNSYSGLTTVTNGTLQLGPFSQNVVLNIGGADIQAGKIVFDYTGGSSPESQILSILDGGYGDGSHPFATGKIHSSTADAADLALGWMDNSTNHAVTVMYTLFGDSDLDGIVGTSDLNNVLSHYGQQSTWSFGDFDYDSIVGASDLGILLTNFGGHVPEVIDASPYAGLDRKALEILAGAGINVVPEPSSLVLLASCFLGILAYAWRKRRS